MHLPKILIANPLKTYPTLCPSILGATIFSYWVCVYPLSARAQPIPELETIPVSLSPILASRQQETRDANVTQSETVPASETLRVSERFGITFESGPQIGNGSAFGSFYGFFPFSQVAGHSTFYTEGQLNFATRAGDVGGNLRLGYRSVLPETDLVWGGYLGWDVRDTEFDNVFHQLGAGVDLQGQNWAVRLNGYLPVGNSQQEIERLRFGTFQGNQLLVTRTFQVAMAGFDLEGGYQLLDWDGGQLYGYAGPYFLTAPEIGSFWGVRGRLVADFNERYGAGLVVSSDDNFGTTVTFQLSARLDGTSRQAEETPAESVVLRLGQPVSRQETITLDRQVETPTVAINPATGEAWRFLHVTDGATGGNGTFENPFGEVTNGVAIAATTGNDVVYVDAGDRSGMNGFAIPANVQVLSSGVIQFVDLSGGGNVQLPGSGTGILPLINGTTLPLFNRTVGGVVTTVNAMVNMGNNSTLSGFQIDTTADDADGVVANNVTNVRVDRNQISTTGNRARGTYIRADGANIGNATISGNRITTTGEDAYGVFVDGTNNATLGTVTVSGNTVATAGDTGKGAYIKISGNSPLDTVTLTGNSITTTGDFNAFGIQVDAGESTLATATVSGNTVTTTGGNGSGIYVRAQNTSGTITTATLSDNTVRTTGNYGDGIVVSASGPNATINNAIVSGNTIVTSGNYSDGIFLQTLGNTSSIDSVTISNNGIIQAGAHLVVMQARNGNERICIADFSGNSGGTANVFGGGGIDINFNPSAGTPGTINFTDLSDVSVNPTGPVTAANVSSHNPGFEDLFITNGTVNTVTGC